jgi:hypothetical protein
MNVSNDTSLAVSLVEIKSKLDAVLCGMIAASLLNCKPTNRHF